MNHPQSIFHRPWVVPVLVITAGLALFAKLGDEVWEQEVFSWDNKLLNFLHAHSSPVLDQIMLTFSRIGGFYGMIFPTAIIFLWLLFSRRYSQAAFWALAVGGVVIINPLLKAVFQRHRPDLWTSIAPEYDFSFPSGHTMGSAAFALAAIILLWPTRWRNWAIGLGTLFALFVAASRLYLGVHFPSDVLAGWAITIAWVGAVGLVLHQIGYRRQQKA